MTMNTDLIIALMGLIGVVGVIIAQSSNAKLKKVPVKNKRR